MIEVVSKGGKKIGELADDCISFDSILVDGKKISLEDAYNDDEIKEKFNKKIKELNDASEHKC